MLSKQSQVKKMDATARSSFRQSTPPLYHAIFDTVPKTDGELLGQVQQRNATALEVLYDRHSAEVLGYAVSILGDRDRAEQVMLEAFGWLWQNASGVESENGEFAAWFYRFVGNRALTVSRRNVHTAEQ